MCVPQFDNTTGIDSCYLLFMTQKEYFKCSSCITYFLDSYYMISDLVNSYWQLNRGTLIQEYKSAIKNAEWRIVNFQTPYISMRHAA